MADVALQDENLLYYQQYTRPIDSATTDEDDAVAREARLFNQTLADHLKRAQKARKTISSEAIIAFVDRLAVEVREIVRLNVLEDRFSIREIVQAMKSLSIHYSDWVVGEEEAEQPWCRHIVCGAVPAKTLSVVEREFFNTAFSADYDAAGYLVFEIARLRVEPSITERELHGWIAEEYKYLAWDMLDEVVRRDGRDQSIVPMLVKLKRWGAHLFGGGIKYGRV